FPLWSGQLLLWLHLGLWLRLGRGLWLVVRSPAIARLGAPPPRPGTGPLAARLLRRREPIPQSGPRESPRSQELRTWQNQPPNGLRATRAQPVQGRIGHRKVRRSVSSPRLSLNPPGLPIRGLY